MKKKKTKKKNNIELHYSFRCLERLGYIPDMVELTQLIQTQQLEFQDRQSLRLTRWKWTDPIHNIPCVLVYDKLRKQIVTVLFDKRNKPLDNIKQL